MKEAYSRVTSAQHFIPPLACWRFVPLGGVAGFFLGGMLTSETGGWGALPGAFGGAVAGGLMGYFGWCEGYYGFDWRAAEIGARTSLDDCMHNAGVCNKNLADQVWDNYWVKGN